MRRVPGRELLLVGGGHAHVQVLRSLAMSALSGVRVTMVVDRPVAVYSGMVPAMLAGEVSADEVEIDVRPLARRAGVAVIVAPATLVDPVRRLVHVAGRPPLRYDLCSLDVGSAVAGGARPDVVAHAIPTRPIGELVARFEDEVHRLVSLQRPIHVVVVGGGVAGVEVAACTRARLLRLGLTVSVTLVSKEAGWIGERPALARRVIAALRQREVTVEAGRVATSVHADRVDLDDGRSLPSDLTLWVTGAAPPEVITASTLPKDGRGYVQVRSTLQVVGHDDLFAAGDCAITVDHPWVPRAGVYAVRAGPVLTANLRASAEGRPLTTWRPQRDFLAILNLGDGQAIATRHGLAVQGAWVWRWKDRIDRRFMALFQRLDTHGGLRPGHEVMAGAEDMACGGCAAKVSATDLGAVLGTWSEPEVMGVDLGISAREDVSAVRLGGASVVASVDGFGAFTDDDWLVGHVAARNATSDLHAKGVVPRFALAWVTAREGGSAACLQQVMAGVRAALADEGVTLVGGHSTVGAQLAVGLTVLGEGPVRWRQDGGRAGDAVVLTRALGAGVLWRADMLGLAPGRVMEQVVQRMCVGNARAARVLADFEVHAATDVTGFGLAGHLAGMMEASGLVARVDALAVPLLPGAEALLRGGLRSTWHDGNAARTDVSVQVGVEAWRSAALFDPQTAGGILACLPAAQAAAAVAALRELGDEPAIIGEVVRDGPRWARVEVR